MIPIHELLSRIRWDAEFGRGRFVVGYLDHSGDRIVRVQLSEVRQDPDNPSLIDLVDDEGVPRSIPLHRVREVFKDGVLIWRRPS